MEFIQMVRELVPEGDEVAVALVTQSDRENPSKQEDQLNHIIGTFGRFLRSNTSEIQVMPS